MATTNGAIKPLAAIGPGPGQVKPINTIPDVKQYLQDRKNDIKGVATDAAKQVFDFGQSVYTQTLNTVAGFGPSSNATAGIKTLGAYFIGIFIILFVISLFIHFFIVPIYSLQPGNPGIINIPLADKGVLFWNDSGKYPTSQSNEGKIKNDDLPINTAFSNYTFIVDIFLYNPMDFSQTGKPRILLSRGAELRTSPQQGDTILTVLSRYNFAVALKPNTSDLIVSVLNANNHSEDIIIENAPIQKTFRLGVVIMEHAMEVYINGKLMKTRKYEVALMDVKNDITSASSTIVKMKNLKIWNNILNSHQIYSAEPPMPKDADFNAPPIQSSSGCTGGPSEPSPSVPPF